MTHHGSPTERVIAAEVRLLDPTVRANRTQLESLLGGTFVEIGQWGRLWSRAEIIEALVNSSRQLERIEISDAAGERILFHQGTRLDA